MSSMIRHLIDRFYPYGRAYMTTIVGLDSSGKTTFLYLLKTGKVVTTIPSIGFNVETVDVATACGIPFRMTGWDVGTGCRDLKYLYDIIRIYIFQSDAIIWLIDSSDRSRLTESVEALQHLLTWLDTQSFADSDEMSHKNFPILILANKSDLPEAMSLDEIRINFAKATSGRLVSVHASACAAQIGVKASGLPEAFDWLRVAIAIAKSTKSMDPPNILPPQMLNQRSQCTLAQKLESWLTWTENDLQPDELLARFKSFTLPYWNHYTHIRIAYVILTKHGRKEGKDMIFEGLKKYIASSSQTKGKAFHFTMTYFWIQIVQFGIRNMPALPERKHTTLASPSSEQKSASLDEFSRFLLINPHVVDGNLWSDYYTNDAMMSPKAKEVLVLPDIKPLPNLVVRDTVTTFGA